jgi:hypothetical protein
VRIYDKNALGRSDAIASFQDGVTAGGWSVLGKQLVDMVARRGKWIEVWMIDRRGVEGTPNPTSGPNPARAPSTTPM